MKLIECVVRPERLEAVQEALGELEVFRLTVCDVQALVQGEAGEDAPRFASRVKLEIAVNEAFVEPTVRAVTLAARGEAASSGEGDGFILTMPLVDVVRIRTGERGPEAI
ncbi:MAG: P-II family nitrogen regulator [Planctomycetota bacterium]|jgi:nitrogen regulatory protein P-II 1